MAAEMRTQDAEILSYQQQFDQKLKLANLSSGTLPSEISFFLETGEEAEIVAQVKTGLAVLSALEIRRNGHRSVVDKCEADPGMKQLSCKFTFESSEIEFEVGLMIGIGQRWFDLSYSFNKEELESESGVCFTESLNLEVEPLTSAWKGRNALPAALEQIFGYEDQTIRNIILEYVPVVVVGDVVTLTKNRAGRVAFIGELPNKRVYHGIELFIGQGKHNGTYKGEQYFCTSTEDSGVFVPNAEKNIISLGFNCLEMNSKPRMSNVPYNEMHGLMAGKDWLPPILVSTCDSKNRPGYERAMESHEYEEDPRTLIKKVKLLAELIRKSEKMMAYTGAGISTSAGIDDYASRQNKNSSIHKNRKKVKGMRWAHPTIGHRVLTQLYFEDYLKMWVQQNHDGLPQKAGFPQHLINEIHGAWWNIANPVCPMSGTLRSDLFEWMEEWQEKADLTLCMGTSLVGMSADDCVSDVAERYIDDDEGYGSVIVGLQRTSHDDSCSIRFYCKIDEMVSLLVRELDIIIPPYKVYAPTIDPENILGKDVFRVPYDSNGDLTTDEDEMIVLDLRPGTKVICNAGSGKGFEATCSGYFDNSTHYKFKTLSMYQKKDMFGKIPKTYYLGNWWLQTLTNGDWHVLPVVNKEVVLQRDYS